MKPRVILQTISAIFITAVLFTMAAFAQTDQGSIAGSVTDANGAVIAGASVTITNEKTGETRTTNAKDDGSFRVVALKPST